MCIYLVLHVIQAWLGHDVRDMDTGIMVVGVVGPDTGSRASKETRTLDRITSNENKATKLVLVCLCLLHQ